MMIPSRQELALTLVTVALAMVAAVPALASEATMANLPVINPFECANCHNHADPEMSGTGLNDFGSDFQIYGWGPELAAMDSDGDGCNNGIEIGDSDGNGEADNGVSNESSNPGASDCSADSEELSWSDLKDLFNGS